MKLSLQFNIVIEALSLNVKKLDRSQPGVHAVKIMNYAISRKRATEDTRDTFP